MRLNNNYINNIDGLFDKTSLLEIINLSKNNLIKRSNNSFKQLRKIKYIDLSENSLSENSKSLFYLRKKLDNKTREKIFPRTLNSAGQLKNKLN